MIYADLCKRLAETRNTEESINSQVRNDLKNTLVAYLGCDQKRVKVEPVGVAKVNEREVVVQILVEINLVNPSDGKGMRTLVINEISCSATSSSDIDVTPYN